MLRRIWAVSAISLLALAATLLTPAPAVWSQLAPGAAKNNPLSKPNLNTVTIVTGGYNTTAARFIGELASKLNDGAELRVTPIFGQGSVQNVFDLLNLRHVDLALVQMDVLAHFQQSNASPNAENQIQYITKLYSEEVHVLSRMQYLCLAELDGRKVNFGPKGSGSSITAEAVFEAHKINVLPLYLDQREALGKLRAGEIDATVYVEGKPSRVFDHIRYLDKVHFLDVEYSDAMQRDYLPALMTYEDYPHLIAPKETVSTIAVSNVLAFYNSKPTSDRLKRVNRFTEKLLSAAGRLKQSAAAPRSLLHHKWRELNIYAPAQGLRRYAAAEAWLEANPAPRAAASAAPPPLATEHTATHTEAPSMDNARAAALFQKLTSGQPSAAPEERQELFNQFLRWYYDNARNKERPSR
jgi:TRAP transporter TAXI family solute receptor